jgi:hypothetical protein
MMAVEKVQHSVDKKVASKDLILADWTVALRERKMAA